MHYRVVIICCGTDQPVCFGNPIVVGLPPVFDMFVMDGDICIAVPAGVFMMKAKDMPQLMRRHPLALSPPERGNVDISPYVRLVSCLTGVVARIGFASETYIGCL